jgi:hypothetical protein
MAKGKQKGHQKTTMTIKDEVLTPYYITLDESQYTLMTEGSTLPIGYFSSLRGAIKRMARLLTVNKLDQRSVTMTEYLDTYDTIMNRVTKVTNI